MNEANRLNHEKLLKGYSSRLMKEDVERIPDSIRGNRRSVANGMNALRAVDVVKRIVNSIGGHADWSETTKVNTLVRESLRPSEAVRVKIVRDPNTGDIASIQIRSLSQPILHDGSINHASLGESFKNSNPTETNALDNDPPKDFVVAKPVEREWACTIENLNGEFLYPERSSDDYEALSDRVLLEHISGKFRSSAP